MKQYARKPFFRLTTSLALSIALIVSFGSVSVCQQAKFLPVDFHQQQYIIDSWQTEQGLPQNSINAILQTRDGYIWLATHDGLVRFNGIQFKIFNMSNTPALKSNRMLSLYEDKEGNLWIGTENGGVTRFKKGVVTSFSMKEGLSWDSVPSVAEDQQGNLWVATSAGGVNLYKDGEFSGPYTIKNSLADNAVTYIYPDSKGNVWLGTGRGLNRITNGTVYNYSRVPPANIPTIREDAKGRLWVGTFNGLALIDGNTTKLFTMKDGLPDNRIHALLVDQDSILWVGTWKGLIQFNMNSFTVSATVEGFSNEVIKSIYKDRESNMWIGTDGGGLRRLKKKILNVYTTAHGLSGDAILGIYQDRQGNMWIGTNCYGLNKFSHGRFTHYTQKDGLSNNCVWGLWEDHEGSIWAGTWSMGVNQFKDGKFIIRTEAEGLSSNVVYALYEDKQRNIWIGTANGLNKFKDGKFTVYNTAEGLPHRNVRVMYEDREGNLWIGTYGGLAKMRDGNITSYTTNEGLSNNYVRAIYEDSAGVLWIGTYGGGLNRFQDGKFTVYNTDNGLFDNGVFHILEDSAGNFWMSSNKGIFRVSKHELNNVALGKKNKVTCFAYGKTEGMLSVECNGGFQSAGWKANDGRFWFPTVKGVVVIDPNKVTTNTLPPLMAIEELVVDGTNIPLNSSLSIEPGKNRYEFHYVGLSYTTSEKVLYQYMLEGYDKTWIDAGNQRIAHYTNIPPGTYTFRVKAANEDDVWNETPAALTVEFRPFFYQTKTFFALCGLAVLLLSAGTYVWRVRHLVRLNLELEGRVNRRTQEILEQKNILASINDELSALLTQLEVKSKQLEIARLKAEEANNAKSEFLAVVSHELRTPLNSVIGFANILRKNKHHDLHEEEMMYLERIVENGKHLLSLIEQMLDLSKIEAGREELHITPVSLNTLIHQTIEQMGGKFVKKEVAIIEEMPDHVQPMETDEGKIKQILMNLISNAIKFTERGNVRIRLDIEPSTTKPLRISIIDTGIGIPEERLATIFEPFKQLDYSTTRKYGGTGLGLAVSKNLAELLGFRIEVQSVLGKGTTFSIVLDEHRSPG